MSVLDPERRSSKYVRVTVRLIDAREWSQDGDVFKGFPGDRFSEAEIRDEFLLLTRSLGEATAHRHYDRLCQMDSLDNFSCDR